MSGIKAVSGISGRTVGAMYSGKSSKKGSRESSKLRAKVQTKPMGKNRFPEGKYFSATTGKCLD